MNTRELKKLWRMRFEKILRLEKESLLFYSKLLKKHRSFLAGTEAKEVLESIMKDEAKHIQIAGELLGIVRDKEIRGKTGS